MKNIIEMMVELNNYYENNNSEKRYWLGNNDIYFVCYNALSDMDDIEEVSEEQIRKQYNNVINK